jgi:hypothetical protein
MGTCKLIIKKHENICVYSVMVSVLSSLKDVRVNERRRMYYGGGKIRVGEERGDLLALCLVLLVLVHLLVWCHDSLRRRPAVDASVQRKFSLSM